MSKTCAVVGIGPGNGAAFARTFATAGWKVALLSRSAKVRDALAEELDGLSVACDATDPDAVTAALGEVTSELGPIDVLIWNAGSGSWGVLEETTVEQMHSAWALNTLGLFAGAQAVQDDMVAAGRGAIIVVGATASLRGGAKFTAFASAKAAQRSLAQSIARHLWPKGIHVALLILDGMVDGPRTRQWAPDRGDDGFLAPSAIADAALSLVNQPRNGWSFEVDLRPAAEPW